MCVSIPKDIKEERLRWVLPIIKKEIKTKAVMNVFPYSQRTLERWIRSYKRYGEKGLIPSSTRSKTNPKETPITIKEKVINLRKDTSLSAIKLSWKLKKKSIILHPRTIGKFLKQEGLARKYRVRKITYKYIKVPLAKGELVEIDVRYVPEKVNSRKYYQFTAIDTASRWRYMKIYEDYSNFSALCFLRELLGIAPFKIKAVKTDNGAYFTNRYTGYKKSTDPQNPRLHPFDLFCQKYNIIHYLIDPGKPYQNGKVERSHRTDKEQFYGKINLKRITIDELQYRLRLWNMYYNDLEHCGLNGKTPNEALQTT